MSFHLPAAAAFAGAIALCPLVLRVLRRHHVVDIPDARSSHSEPTPRGGGAAVAIAALSAGALGRGAWHLRAVLLLAATAMCVVGIVEDIRGIPVGSRFTLHLTIGVLSAPLLLAGAGLDPIAAGVAAVVGVAWLVAFVNAFNFMDGVNGISAVEAIVAGLFYAWLGRGRYPILVDGGLVVAGAAAGFLPFNFPRARMFLGDAGSYLLGAWLAILAVVALRYRLGPVAAVAPLALYSADTGMTLARRIVAGEVWRQPHRSHIYQRLVQGGWSHTAVTAVVGGAVAVCSLLGIAARGQSVVTQTGLAALIAAVVLAYMALPWLTSRRIASAVA